MEMSDQPYVLTDLHPGEQTHFTHRTWGCWAPERVWKRRCTRWMSVTNAWNLIFFLCSFRLPLLLLLSTSPFRYLLFTLLIIYISFTLTFFFPCFSCLLFLFPILPRGRKKAVTVILKSLNSEDPNGHGVSVGLVRSSLSDCSDIYLTYIVNMAFLRKISNLERAKNWPYNFTLIREGQEESPRSGRQDNV